MKQKKKTRYRLSTGTISIAMLLTIFIRPACGADLPEIKQSGVLRHLGVPYARFVAGSGDGMDMELIKLFKVIGPMTPMQEMACGFAKTSPTLREAFNRFLEQCKENGSYPALAQKYYPDALLSFPEFFEKKDAF